jgi:hypothetical protein
VSLVEALRVDAVEALHAAGEERAGGLDDDVVVRAHQAEGVRPPVATVDDGAEEAQECAAVVVVPVRERAHHRPRGDVVDPVREVASQLSRHRSNVGGQPFGARRCGRIVTQLAQVGPV